MKTVPMLVSAAGVVDLSQYDPSFTGDLDKEKSKKRFKELRKELAEHQKVLYASGKHAVLIILQGMDASGKDGTVANVLSGLNPSGVHVHSFKAPTDEERRHDFLWRIHPHIPPLGTIGIFNRSHYEDVLIVRVHELFTEDVIERRYDYINGFEQMLTNNGVIILKFFLHISKEEQGRRILKRKKDLFHQWKYSIHDRDERKFWDQYRDAFEIALTRCSLPWATWHIVPSDHKWFRNLYVAETLVKTLRDLKLEYPKLKRGV